MEAKKPRPAQVVVDSAKVAETPLGMTRWSGNEEGHELEDAAVGFQGEMAAKLKREASAIRERYAMHQSEARRLSREMNKYLEPGPEANYEDLRRNMAIMAVHIEECLVRGGAGAISYISCDSQDLALHKVCPIGRHCQANPGRGD